MHHAWLNLVEVQVEGRPYVAPTTISFARYKQIAEACEKKKKHYFTVLETKFIPGLGEPHFKNFRFILASYVK